MDRIFGALKPGGILYASFKHGHETMRARDGRLFHDMSGQDLARLARSHGLEIAAAWHSSAKLRGTNETDWNNLIARKPN